GTAPRRELLRDRALGREVHETAESRDDLAEELLLGLRTPVCDTVEEVACLPETGGEPCGKRSTAARRRGEGRRAEALCAGQAGLGRAVGKRGRGGGRGRSARGGRGGRRAGRGARRAGDRGHVAAHDDAVVVDGRGIEPRELGLAVPSDIADGDGA